MPERWEHFEHMADMGIRGISDSKDGAFAQAALALTAVMHPPKKICPSEVVTVYCEALDPEILLYEWLNAVIYEMATRHLLFGHFDVVITAHQLRAVLYGEPISRLVHKPAVEVKGATFTALKLYRAESGSWVAQCVVDV